MNYTYFQTRAKPWNSQVCGMEHSLIRNEPGRKFTLWNSTWNSDIKKPFAKRKNTWSQIYQHSGGENATSSQIYHLWPSLCSTSECFLSLARQPAWEAKHTWTKWLTCQKTYHLPNGILTLHALPPSSHLQELGMVQQCLSLFPALPTWLTIRSACKLVSWSLSTTGAWP